MKEPIEEIFKQSLKGHEMPYNPDAWKAMNARLDAVSPVATPTSYLKYYLGAAGIGVAAIATYLFLANGTETENTSDPVAQETRTEQTTDNSVTTNATNNSGQTDASDISDAKIMKTTDSNDSDIMKSESTEIMKGITDAQSSEISSTANNDIPATHSTSGIDADQVVTHKGHKEDPVVPSSNTVVPRIEFIMPVVSDMCLNEESTITNKNSTEVYVLDGLGQIIETIPAEKSILFKPEKVGNYAIGYETGTGVERGANFRVNRIPDAEFTVDLINKYEDGLPSTHVEGIGGQGTYIWKAGTQTITGTSSDLHFYKKGDQTIELTVNNGQCASTVEKTIFIENDYNLMAVTGFTPMSNDPKTNTFMPFALTQRDVNFTMTIIDGRDGGIVYQTSDATLPWDGTDIRSGRRSDTPQVYVWKVTIANPAVNEPTEYVGTITMN